MSARSNGVPSPGRRRIRTLVSGLAATGLALFVAAPVVGDGLNSHPSPAPQVIAATVPATSAQVAAASGLAGVSARRPVRRHRRIIRTVFRRVVVSSRITDHEILTEEGKGTFVGIRCPGGAKAISGGILSRYINLLISSSAPNHPLNGRYTPHVWWVTVTNVNVDGNGGTLPWQGVVNCISPARIGPR